MNYKSIETKFWGNKDVKKLSRDAKLTLLYLKSNDFAHYSGIYRYVVSEALEEIGITERSFYKTLDELSEKKENSDKSFILYDKEEKLVWVVNMLHYTLKNGNRTNLIKGTGKYIGKLQHSPLLNAFYNEYKDLDIPIPMGYEWVKDPSFTGTGTFTGTGKDNDGEEKKSDGSIGDYVKNHSGKGFERMKAFFKPDFEEIWKRYPNKQGKDDAKVRFEKNIITEKDWKEINQALDSYIAHVNKTPWLEWQNGSTWFNKNWKDFIGWKDPQEKGRPGSVVKVCTKETPMPSDSKENWRHVDFELIDENMKKYRCRNCNFTWHG